MKPRHAPLPCLVALLSALGVGQAPAADRALLVGVGHYGDASIKPLQGIDIDLDRMRTVARQLGFTPADTRVLSDGDATLAKVQAELGDWVRTGVGPDDRVLIYFSTHGAQVPDLDGDEDDGEDEALVMYDVRGDTTADGTPTLANVLVDDDLKRALAAIPSRNILVVVDACHSGTVTRDLKLRSLRLGTDEAQVKFHAYPGMPVPRPQGASKGVSRLVVNYVSLSAAADDEESLATPRGSLFTQALAQAIAAGLDQRKTLTPRDAHRQTTDLIASALNGSEVFHPRLDGAPALIDKPLRLIATTAGQGPNRDAIEALARGMTPLTIKANRQSFRPGELLELTIDVPQDGYLNVVGIDPEDHAIVAFPNQFHTDNRVQKGQVRIPGKLGFELPAEPPFGPTLLVAFLTDRPINLFQTSDGARDPRGKVLDAFPPVSYAGLRGFRPTAPSTPAASAPAGFAGTLEVRICPATGCP